MPKQLTTAEFIRRSTTKFPGQFTYRTTAYVDATTKIELGCPQHGSFHVLPSVHLREMGRGGCARCAGNARITTTEFIALATKIQSGRYDYARARYMGAKLKVEIVCPRHGVFFQAGSDHLSGKGCPKCADEARKGVWSANLGARAERFVACARAVHGDKYDYALVAYQSSTVPVEILCPEHGPFHQSPGSHLSGKGCPKCGLRAGGLVRRVGTQEFIQRAREVHGDRYDYSLTSYETTHKQVVITCDLHGPFKQDPSNHLAGKGCKRCAMLTNANTIIARRGSDIVEGFRAVHGDFYGYDSVIYEDSRTKVLVGCPLHGEFSVTPANHLSGTGCPKCARESRPDFIDARIKNDLEFANRPGFIYVLNVLHRATGRKFFKVGVTSMVTPAARFNYTRYEGFELSVRRAEAGTMRRVWETERLVKKLIKKHGFNVRRFAGDYWHWTESFEGESAIQAVEGACPEFCV